MDKLIIEGSIRTIVINEKGDTISINFQDRGEYNKLIVEFQGLMDIYEKTMANGGLSMQKIENLCTAFENTLNRTFGEDTVIKAFGVEHPSLPLLISFFIQILNIIYKFKDIQDKGLERLWASSCMNKYIKKSSLKLRG